MHLVNRLLLKAVLAPAPFFRKMGVDEGQLKAILTLKLVMDDRRPNTLHLTGNRKRTKEISGATIGTIIVSGFMGLLYLMAFMLSPFPVTEMTFYFSFFFFMLASSLITEFTTVLIDVRDNLILLPKPVNDRTLVFARILHVAIHLCKIVLPMCLPGAVYLGYTAGPAAVPVFVLMVAMLTLFTLFFINALYIVILRVTTPERFKAIISWVQILFAIGVYSSSQILPQLSERLGALQFNAESYPLLMLYPPFWFASGWQVLTTFSGDAQLWTMAGVSLLVPVGCFILVIRYLAPTFNNKLALLSTGHLEGAEKAPKTKTQKRKEGFATTAGRLLTRSGPERMGFLFTWKMMSRSREFRMRVYPAIGYLVVYGFMMMIRGENLQLDDFRQQTDTGRKVVLIAMYSCGFLVITALQHIRFSDKFKAAWIYFTAPVEQPGVIIIGAIKAALLMFYMPVLVAVTCIGLYLSGLSILPNLLLGLVNQLMFAAFTVFLNTRVLPFSTAEGMERKAGSFVRGLALFAAIGLLGLTHYLIYPVQVVVLIVAVLSAAAAWLLLDNIRRTTWEKVIYDMKEL